MQESYEKKISKSVDSLITSLNSMNDLTMKNVSDDRLNKSFETIKNTVFAGVLKIKRDIEELSNNAEWGKLNVSFFGETNAGKSTIIEALINGDGKSIGKGFKDFTTDIKKIPYNKINLLDMPGIEGQESSVIKIIQEAVNKSHIIFYVVGTNKEPEEQTILKMRELLGDNVRVYTIINQRGKPTKYKYTQKLMDENTLAVSSRIRKKFSKLLGKNYSKNIVVNGYLALMQNSNIKMGRFLNDQKKALEIFGSNSEIKKFSNIEEIFSLLKSFGNDFKSEIIISNTYKFLSSLNSILTQIDIEKKSFNKFIKDVNSLNEKYFVEIDNIIKKYDSLIKSSLSVNIGTMKSALKKGVSESIDNNEKQNQIESKLNNIKVMQSEKLNLDIADLLSDMKKEIENRITEFKNRLSIKIELLNYESDFDFKTVLESLNINTKYIFGQIVDIGFSVIGIIISFAIHPIVGIINVAMIVLKKIWDWFFSDPAKRKRKTKGKAISKIDSLVNKMEYDILHDVNRELLTMQKKTKEPVKQLQASMKEIKNLSKVIDDKLSQIEVCQTSISNLLMEEILGQDVVFSYIDLAMSRAVVIGPKLNKKMNEWLFKTFRLKQIEFYLSEKEWLNATGRFKHKDLYITVSKFNHRAVKALILSNKHSFKCKKVLKRSY